MDTRNGAIHTLVDNETAADLVRRYGGKSSDFVPVDALPSSKCAKCNGTGAVRRGLLSKRFKPCECTHRQ